MSPTSDCLDDGTVLAMGKAFRRADHGFHQLDTALIKASVPETKARQEADAARMDAKRWRLFYRVFNRRAETVSDIAVIAAHGFYEAAFMLRSLDAERLECSGLGERLERLRRAFAAITTTAATSANLDLSQIGFDDLVRAARKVLAQPVSISTGNRETRT